MARYSGPVCRLCRRERMKLFLKGDRCFKEKCAIERRAYPPGQHGQRRGRRPQGYGPQLREKLELADKSDVEKQLASMKGSLATAEGALKKLTEEKTAAEERAAKATAKFRNGELSRAARAALTASLEGFLRDQPNFSAPRCLSIFLISLLSILSL